MKKLIWIVYIITNCKNGNYQSTTIIRKQIIFGRRSERYL